ncbi:MAG: NAD-dependent epimerase/dehydratase family protein [Acidobacteriota bacterium]
MQIDKAAVLGATGATGFYLTRELLRRQIHVRVVSRSREHLEARFRGLDVEIVPADLMDPEAASRAVETCDLLFHCVGLPVDRYPDHLVITRNVVEAARKANARCLLLGAFWSYGPARSNPVKEDGPRNPTSLKARIRMEQEDLFQMAGAAVAILPDFYGPQADIGFVNPALRAIAAGKPANWIGTLDRPRELIYVPDLGFPIVELALREEAYGERWNVSGPGAVIPRDLFETAGRLCGREPKIRVANRLLLAVFGLFNRDVRALRELYSLYMHPPILDARKLHHLIGDYPITSYEEGIRRTLEWIRE